VNASKGVIILPFIVLGARFLIKVAYIIASAPCIIASAPYIRVDGALYQLEFTKNLFIWCLNKILCINHSIVDTV
jgi:hypothetical protein